MSRKSVREMAIGAGWALLLVLVGALLFGSLLAEMGFRWGCV